LFRPTELDDILLEQKQMQEKLSLVLDMLGNRDQCNDIAWLMENREERMDATLPLFDEGRRLFHLARYDFAASYIAGGKVADIACGTGYGSRALSEQGQAFYVIGVDVSEEAIRYAQRRHSPPRVEFRAASGDDTGLQENDFDVVVSFETIEHVADERAFLREFKRLLKPGGLLICSVPNQWPLAKTPHHVKEYDFTSFCSLLSEFFDVEKVFNQNSGCDFEFNRGQPAGIIETTDENRSLAECFIAVCRKRSESDAP
jgi:2-polyprenyl-3-methyl-5-hydroxy-6-metoxy-1,4-benzoquinol methylase